MDTQHIQRSPLQFKSMHNILCQTLPDSVDTYNFASHISREQIDVPLYLIISSLLAKEVHLHTLLTALSSCEEHQLKYAFDAATSQDVERQLSSAKKIIRHFNTIQDMLLATAESYFDTQSDSIKQDNLFSATNNKNLSNNNLSNEFQTYQQTIIDSIKVWEGSKSITIRNYYNGLTIGANTTFITGIDEGEIQVMLNEEVARVFTVHPSESDAFALCEGQEIQVRLTIKSVSKNLLTLHLGKTFPVHSENRKDICIQIQEQVPITISMNKKRQLHARLQDLSAGGLGINVYGISKAPYNIGDKVKCELTLNSKEIAIDGIVRWTSSIDEEARVGIAFKRNSAPQELIEKEVFRLQRDIINTINQLVIPDLLKKGLTN